MNSSVPASAANSIEKRSTSPSRSFGKLSNSRAAFVHFVDTFNVSSRRATTWFVERALASNVNVAVAVPLWVRNHIGAQRCRTRRAPSIQVLLEAFDERPKKMTWRFQSKGTWIHHPHRRHH